MSDNPNSPGLGDLGRYVASLRSGEVIYWTPSGWSRTGPGVEYVKDQSGFLKPKRRNDA